MRITGCAGQLSHTEKGLWILIQVFCGVAVYFAVFQDSFFTQKIKCKFSLPVAHGWINKLDLDFYD